MKFVYSLGGSRIVPNDIDVRFLRSFKDFVEKNKSSKFFIVTGGGSTARKYQSAMKLLKVNDLGVNNTNLDRIGILATKINSFLVENLFFDKKNVFIFSGTTPGHSTDYVTVKLAIKEKVSSVVNISNIRFVYNLDPRFNKSAKKFKKLSHDEFLNLFDKNWKPGMNIPFDVKAIRLAKRNKIRILFAKTIKDLEKINSGEIPGTIIS